MSNPNTALAGERVQSFLYDQTQQGNTYVPGKEARRSRRNRAKGAIQGLDEQFPQPPSAQAQAQGGQSSAQSQVYTNTAGHQYTPYDQAAADLYGVGQQFQGYGHQ